MRKESVLLAMDRAEVFRMRCQQMIIERGLRGAQKDWDRGTRASGRLRRAGADLQDALIEMRRPSFRKSDKKVKA